MSSIFINSLWFIWAQESKKKKKKKKKEEEEEEEEECSFMSKPDLPSAAAGHGLRLHTGSITSKELIGGLSVFGLAVQHLLPAISTEPMCQFIVGSPHTSALRRP
ncbi:unnamed protein product [Pleuronectes platessa]|uniref:Uncharacterized protein n=1 Tax=Pleuronectes platessa TaxID=8262 RepID=A0A9N7YHR7_PLEPL|nr:unnamed protein product [Pleuronectes platessa]